MNKKIILTIASILLLIACNCTNSNNTTGITPGPNCEYAAYFGILNSDSSSTILIKSLPHNNDNKSPEWEEQEVTNSYNRIVCMSTSHISYIEALGMENTIVGISGGEYVSSEYIRDGLINNRVKDIGFENSLNYELLISLSPDLVIAYGIKGENNQYIDKMKQMGIKVIVLGDYIENHPLGKLEYIKLFGHLLNKREMADSIYEVTKVRYNKLKETTISINKKNVLLNALWKDVWYIPGENNYMNILINDAGGVVLGASSGSEHTKPFGPEEVFIMSAKADFWLNPNAYTTIEELVSANRLFANTNLIKEKLVYNNNRLRTRGGGSQFWEKGVMEPDIILKDLISILHPHLIENYEPKYYYRLK